MSHSIEFKGVCTSEKVKTAIKVMTTIRKLIMKKVKKLSSKKAVLKFVDFKGLSFEKIKPIILTGIAKCDMNSEERKLCKKNLQTVIKFREDVFEDVLKIQKANPEKYENGYAKSLLNTHYFIIMTYCYYADLIKNLEIYIKKERKALDKFLKKENNQAEKLRISNMIKIFKDWLDLGFNQFKTLDFEQFLENVLKYYNKKSDCPLNEFIQVSVNNFLQRIQEAYVGGLKLILDKVTGLELKKIEQTMDPNLKLTLKPA